MASRPEKEFRSHEVTKALVCHPNTPLSRARSLLPQLYWKDLADAAEDPKVPPGVRKHAEEVLKRRLEELTQGERVSLARRASRGVIGALLDDTEPRVLEALLGNGRLMENDAVRIATSQRAPRDVLTVLAGHPVWGVRASVRLSLLANPRTPVPVALRLVADLPQPDVERLARDVRVPRIVRIGADRRLEGRSALGRNGRRG